jgi:tetratricopeptide (TPR) repeat protein
MKILKNILFVIILVAVPVGVLFKMILLPGGILITLGLFGMFLYFAAKTIKDYVNRRNNISNIVFQICVVLTSVILFSKYQFYYFGDYPGLLIVPWFILEVLRYFIKGKQKDIKLTSVSIIYLILVIPLFCFDFWNSPRKYIPQEWVNRYDIEGEVGIDLPYGYRYVETEQLSQKADQLAKRGLYDEAIIVLHEAHSIEPDNPWLLFDLSAVYSKTNLLETAISLLNAAIELDSTNAAFYNNRGLLHYKLKENNQAIADFTKAVQLDLTQPSIYVNLTLVYYYENKFELACQSLESAEHLGFDINTSKYLKNLKKRYCNAKKNADT